MHFPRTEPDLFLQGMDTGAGQETGSPLPCPKSTVRQETALIHLSVTRRTWGKTVVLSSPKEHVPTTTVSTTHLQWTKYCLDFFQGALSPNAHCDAPNFPRGIMPYKDKMPPGNATQPRHLFPLPNVVQPFRSHNWAPWAWFWALGIYQFNYIIPY